MTRVAVCSYHQSLSQHMTDDELDVLKSFRVPGRILFVRASKLARKQPYASPPPLSASFLPLIHANVLCVHCVRI